MASLKDYQASHFRWTVSGPVAQVMIDRPDKKNPLTFESYAELRDTFEALRHDPDIKAVVLTGADGNFCAGGDVFEIIEPLTKMDMPDLLKFTRMTGAVVKAMRACPQPIVAAIDGVCVGAGACLAMASDIRFGTPASKVAFLFTRVGLAGCDMGACAMLPRIIGHGRAAELFYSGRVMKADEAERWGFYNRLCNADEVLADATSMAEQLATGPSFAHGITKRMMHEEWDMSIDEAIEAEARAQAVCMATRDFKRAFEAFAEKREPVFKGD